MFKLIKGLLDRAWNWIKKIFVKILSFFNNIKLWFTERSRLKKLQENEQKIAVGIKEKLENGDYNVVPCIFDKNSNKIDDAEVIISEKLDQETKNKFGDKDMIILS